MQETFIRPKHSGLYTNAEGSEKDIYNNSKNKIYFSIKNFGTLKDILNLILYDSFFLIAYLGYSFFSKFLLRQIGLKELIKRYKDIIKGRIDGYRDGLLLLKSIKDNSYKVSITKR